MAEETLLLVSYFWEKNWRGGGGDANGKQRVITCHYHDLPYLLLVYFQMTQRKDL